MSGRWNRGSSRDGGWSDNRGNNSRGSSWGDRRSQGRGNNANGSSRGGRWNTGGPSRGGGRADDSWDTWPSSNDIETEDDWDGVPPESDVRSEGTGVTNLPGGGDTGLANTRNIGQVREDSRGDTRSGNAWNPRSSRGDTRPEDRRDARGNSRGDTRSGNAWNTGPVRGDTRTQDRRGASGNSRGDARSANAWDTGPQDRRDASGTSRGDTRSGNTWNPGPVRDTRSEVTRDAGGCSRDDMSHNTWNPGPVRDTRSEVTRDAGGCTRDDTSHNTWNTGRVRDIRSQDTRDDRESIVGERRSDGGLDNSEPSRCDRRSEVARDASGSNIADRRSDVRRENSGSSRGERRTENRWDSSGPSRDDGKFDELPGTSNGSSGRSKRPREPSPAPSSTAGPAIRINTSIFETDPSETDNNSLPEDNQDVRDVKRKIEKGDPEITDEMQSLGNFFSFTDPSKSLPNVAPQRNVGEAGAPVPKMPKVAHYNAHNPEEEVQYVEEGRRLYDQAIPDHQTDSGDSDDEILAPLRKRKHLRDEIFNKYDFKKRSIDVSKLMAYENKDKIINAIEGNRVVIIDGFTGCGKTTQIPQLIIDRAAELRKPCNVIVTQPRRLAAVSVARRVCEERCWELGTVVGYQVGMDKRVTKNETLVTYMTTGVLLRKLTGCKNFQEWTHIIVDEVHERDLETDLLLLLIKKILIEDKLGKKRNVKLILMSATVNARQFSQYFAVSKRDDENVETPVIKIPTIKKYKIEDVFLDQLVSSPEALDEIYSKIDMERATLIPELYTQAVRTIKELDREEASHDPRLRHGAEDKLIQRERGSVLVFLPGIMEIKTMCKLLNEENRKQANNDTKFKDPDPFQWDIVNLHSSVTNDEQRKVFDTPKPYRRKIILSTNIAESSITVPDIVYVIDFCLTKSNCVDARTNFNCLRLCWASISQCIQRAGRSGRVRDGKVYRMIPKKTYAQLEQDAKPDMLKSALESVVLQVKYFDMGSPKDILCLALDPPEISGIERAVSNLKEVGAMTVMTTVDNRLTYSTCDGDITFMGQIMTSLPISPQCSRLILLGHCFGVTKEAIIIAAGLSGKSPFSTPFNKQLDSYLQKLNWAKKSYSDCLAILHAYRAWYKKFAETDDYLGVGRKNYTHEKHWARTQNIQLSQMREIRNMVEDIEQRLKNHELAQYRFPVECSMETDNLPKEIALMLKIAIAGAFYPNYFHRQRPYDLSTYERDRSKEVNGQDLFSTVYYKGFPYGHNGKLYAKHVADFLSYGLGVPYIIFESQKVLAIFDSTGKKIGPISEGVYRAIKKRQIQDNLEFNLIWKEEEKEEVHKHAEEVRGRHFNRCPPQITLPGIDKTKIGVFVTHIVSPSQFWIVYKEANEKHTEIDEKVNGNITKNRVRHKEAYVGALVLAPFKDEVQVRYYRGRIQTPPDGIGYCLIYFIDYGNSERISVNELLELPKELIQQDYNRLPGLAVECRLCLLKPAIVHGSVWAEAAIDRFKSFTSIATLFELIIHAVDKSVISGDLRSIPGNHLVPLPPSINKWLLDEGFADPAPEPYTANLNFKARGRFDLIRNDRRQIEACNEQQIAETIDRDFIPPPRHGSIPCTLKGPYSPLELYFQSVCQSSNAKQVAVDNHSVNSVILDHEPTAPTARLLVASSITIQEKSGKVVARETTMMPATPGMLALMSLIFAPRAELRCDTRMSRYTGALCGLGTDNLEEPIYMDHDLEVVFDTEIDDDDIDLINCIRHNMNVVLRESQGQNNAPVHTRLCRDFIKLLKKPRKRVEEEIYPQESYVWNRITPSRIVTANRRHFPVQPLDIFLPHDKIHLTAEDYTVESFDFAV